MYLVFGTENVGTLFQNSKHLSRDNLTRQAFHNSNAKIKAGADVGSDGKRADATNSTTKSIAEINDEEAARISRKLHDMQHLYLSQPAEVRLLTGKFSESLQEAIRKALNLPDQGVLQPDKDSEDKHSARTVPLFRFLEGAMFVASTAALMGTRILELNPNLVYDYWAYDKAFLLGLPELVYPEGKGARDKLLEAVRRYVEEAHNASDWKGTDKAYWDANVGSKLFRESLKEMDSRGIALEDQAGALLSLVWATASNSIPLTGWVMSTVLEDRSLLAELRKELAASFTSEPDSVFSIANPGMIATFDLSRLSSLPLLSSIYYECLRLRTSTTVTRRLTTDVEIGGYTLRKGNFVMAPSYLAHTDNSVWADGDETDARHFQPKRFCKSEQTEKTQTEGEHPEDPLRPETFLPYGGGNAICPGRFFSKQQILVATAILVLMLDMELEKHVGLDGKTDLDKAPVPDQRYAGGGVMPPEGDWIVRIRAREKLKHES